MPENNNGETKIRDVMFDEVKRTWFIILAVAGILGLFTKIQIDVALIKQNIVDKKILLFLTSTLSNGKI
jgi:hypothetical protein